MQMKMRNFQPKFACYDEVSIEIKEEQNTYKEEYTSGGISPGWESG